VKGLFIKYIYIFFFSVYTLKVLAQQFDEQNLKIEGTAWGKVIIADIDNDHDLDIFINGLKKNNTKTATFYLNNGNLNFAEINPLMPAVFRGDASWGDINNDGFPDIIYCGLDNDYKSRTVIYLNNGQKNFTYFKELDGIINGKIIVKDFNADSKNDIFIIGRTNKQREAIIYFSEERGFSKKILSFGSVLFPEVSAINFNGDSLPDLIVSGRSLSFGRFTKIYINKNNGNFELADITLPGFSKASISVYDLDNNGYEDFLISGSTKKGTRSKLYMNAGGTLTLNASPLIGIYRGDNAFFDFNSDGRQDIIISGYNEEKPITKLYINNGENRFTDSNQLIEGVYDGNISTGDTDADGDVDFLINGRTKGNNYLLILYLNNHLKSTGNN